jgi:hypothetical protein
LDAGADVNEQDTKGRRALTWAKKAEIERLLIDAGAER